MISIWRSDTKRLTTSYKIIAPHLHAPLEPRRSAHMMKDIKPEHTPPPRQTVPSQRSFANSSTHSQQNSMPSLVEGLEDVNMRSSNPLCASNVANVPVHNRTPTWTSASQYNMYSPPYNASPSQAGTLPSQHMSTRESPNLPSFREVNNRSGYDTTFVGPNAHMAYMTGPNSYNQPFPTLQTPVTFLARPSGLKRASRDPVSYDRHSVAYSSVPRSSSSVDFAPFNSSSCDSYRYSPGFRTSCPEIGFSPNYGFVGNQSSDFNLPTDASGNHGRRRRQNLPKEAIDVLRGWFHEHLDHPYPTDEDKQYFVRNTHLTTSQISNWFINARRRNWPGAKQNRERQVRERSRNMSVNGKSDPDEVEAYKKPHPY